MKKLLFIAVVLVAIAFTSSSKEEAVQPVKASVQKIHQTGVDAIKVVSTAKETTSWD